MLIEYRDRELKGEKFHPSHILDNIYRRRGLTNMSDLEYNLRNLLPPNFMGMDDAVKVLEESLRKDDRIMVVADYDCDGATSCAIAVEGLRMFGFSDVRFMVPDRFTMGYGISPKVVDHFKDHEPDLVVTVDNGISAFDGCKAVKSLEHPCKLLITDHHLGGDTVPVADAIVNPNQVGCPFPSKAVAGCGVIFYTLLSFRSHLRKIGWFKENNIPEPDLNNLLDIVALGTVADVVPLDFNNRMLVWHGLNRINQRKGHPGIQALADISKIDVTKMVSTDFGFQLGPKINSAGRLEDMTIGINCLLAKTYEEAASYAEELELLNVARKQMTAEISTDAYSQLDLPEETTKHGLCVYGDDFNEGIIGIVASRIKEMYHRPIIVFTKAEDGAYKGSGRSVPGVHLRDVLINVDRRSDGRIMQKYGGHAMAAGMSLNPEYFEEFQDLFDQEVKKVLPNIEPVIETDGVLAPEDFTLETAALIERSGPWGQHFPKPMFRGSFVLKRRDPLKGGHLKMVLSPIGSEKEIDGICFFCLENQDSLHPEGTVLQLVYELSINEFRGNVKLQLMVKDFRPATDQNIKGDI